MSNPLKTERTFERVPITPGNLPTLADYDAALMEIERLTAALAASEYDLKIQKGVVEFAYIPHQHLTASNDKLRLQLTASEKRVSHLEDGMLEIINGIGCDRDQNIARAYLAKGETK